ncbi:transcription factor 19 isoform X2 [Marmota marmota marmota]|uniref:transcription factor 19 isoform X2 n=1 Tax=Marmota marmota marmota TaxID=9994 RepID=UPI0020934846|nr:transcription factor 19 isoform X2 [Marmota marmota marmota]
MRANKRANQEGHGGRARSARSQPGNSEGGVDSARAQRLRLSLPQLPGCQTAARAGAGALAFLRRILPGAQTIPRLHYAGRSETGLVPGRKRPFCLAEFQGTSSRLIPSREAGTADLCDVALRPQQEPGLISGIHAELHAERRGDDWRVSVEDHSSQGTLVNNVRLPRGHRLELSDGDLLTFGPERPPGTSPSEFYFMFQQVRVKPQDFAAITIPRSRGEARAGFLPMLPSQGAPQRPLSTLSPAPKATLILNSIGSLSKIQPQPLTFSRSGGGPQSLPVPTPAGEVGTTPAPPPRNRRKSAHRVLAELDDESEAPESPQPVLTEPRKKLRVEKTPLTPSGNRRGRPRKHPEGMTTRRGPLLWTLIQGLKQALMAKVVSCQRKCCLSRSCQ